MEIHGLKDRPGAMRQELDQTRFFGMDKCPFMVYNQSDSTTRYGRKGGRIMFKLTYKTRGNSSPQGKGSIMMQYDLFMSYSSKNWAIADAVVSAIESRGVKVWYAPRDVVLGSDYAETITTAIANCKYVVAIISADSQKSKFDYVYKELELAMRNASDRAKTIIPVLYGIEYSDLTDKFRFLIGQHQARFINEENSVDMLADQIAELNEYDDRMKLLSDSQTHASSDIERYNVLCSMIDATFHRIQSEPPGKIQRELIMNLIGYQSSRNEVSNWFDREEAIQTVNAGGGREQIKEIRRYFCETFNDTNDVFYLSALIQIISLHRESELNFYDSIYNGDVRNGGIAVPGLSTEDYAKQQAPYVQKYRDELSSIPLSYEHPRQYNYEEVRFILVTEHYIYKGKESEKTIDDEDQLLMDVAAFVRDGNRLFERIGEHELAEGFMRCVLTSYERLRNYCEVVGNKKVHSECVECIAEINQKLSSVSYPKKPSPKAENGIKSLLGLTIPRSGNYDVFISHKSCDFDIAEDMYHFLKNKQKEIFLDKLSLPEMAESLYEKSIMAALDGAKHFVVILSDITQLDSHWIRLEMDIFQTEINEGRKANSNFIMVVTGSLYKEIINSNKAILPIKFRRCEIMRVQDYKDSLIRYIT